jgi:hypothetical protein
LDGIFKLKSLLSQFFFCAFSCQIIPPFGKRLGRARQGEAALRGEAVNQLDGLVVASRG